MKLLLKAAFKTKKHYVLLIITLISMFALTVTSQMEMFALGVLTKSGPDFFTLFAPEQDGKLTSKESISWSEFEAKWKQIDTEGKGAINKADVAHYAAAHKDTNVLNRIIHWLDQKLNLTKSLFVLTTVLISIAILRAAALFGSRYFTQLVSIRVSRDLRQAYFEHIQSLPLSFYQKHNIGALSSRVVADASVVASSINAALMNYLQAPFTIISSLILCFYLSWELSLLVFFGLPLVVFPIVFIAGRIKRISKRMQKNQEGFSSVLIDFLAGIQTIKMFAMEELSVKKYKQQNSKMAVLEEKSARYGSISKPVLHTVGGVFLVAALLYGNLVAQMTISEILVFCGLLYLFYEPVKKFGEENCEIQRGVTAAERMFEVLHLQPSIQDIEGAVALSGPIESIEFDNVWFQYSDQWILKGLSFRIEKGESVAIVGPTGAGKSTIVHLLPRLYDVQKGEIRINGKPLHCYTQRSLRENISFVSQKPFIFLDTVKENISFGRPFSQEEVEHAAKKAQADEFIQKLPHKYETFLEETGKNLSGGQLQRLAIARALVKKAPVLILDEATSALDSISESRIKVALESLRGKMIQLQIAHRLSTIENADKIIYIENGEKLAEGNKTELMHTCPSFRLMWEMMHTPENSIAKHA